MNAPPRRIVTGHGADGRSLITHDDRCPHVATSSAFPGLRSFEVWEAVGMPVPINSDRADPMDRPHQMQPVSNGCRIRIGDIPPDPPELKDTSSIEAFFQSLGSPHVSTSRESTQPHPLMHKTDTVDFGIIIEGHLTLILDDQEVTLGPGDVCVQRGTNHAWSNRTDKTVRVAFVLLDGVREPPAS